VLKRAFDVSVCYILAMHILLWPIISRDRLVCAFRPGEPASSEAPFRTLRKHSWSTGGVRITPRAEGRAAGRMTLFSTLNLEAVRLARLDETRSAARIAKVAVAVESSRAFSRFGQLLARLPAESVRAVAHGLLPATAPNDLWDALLRLTEETERRWKIASEHIVMPEVITGRITQLGTTALVLHVGPGPDITLPRWLARAAERDVLGGCLGLVFDQFENGAALTYALPALDLHEAPPRFSPYGQHAPPLSLTADDVEMFKREAPELRVPVPVTIGG